MLKTIAIKLIIALSLLAPNIYASEQTPLRHFAEFSTWSSIKISPDGSHLAGIVDTDSGLGGSKLMVIDTKTMENLHQISIGGSGFIGSFVWANNERLIAWEAVKSGIQEIPFSTGNIIAVNIDGTKKRWIYGAGKKQQSHLRRFSSRVSASVAHKLPEDDRHVLMEVYTWGSKDGAYTRLVKLNIYNGREISLGSSPIKNASLMIDPGGALRFAYGSDIDDEEAWKVFQRQGENWKLLSRTDEYKGRLIPEAFVPNEEAILVLDNIDTDTEALYHYNLESGEKTLLYKHPYVDVGGIEMDLIEGTGNTTGYLAGVWVEPDYKTFIPLSEESEYNRMLLALQAQFPEHVVEITSETSAKDLDRELAVVSVRSDKLPGMYLLFDKTNKKLSRIRQAHSYIDPSKMRPMEPYKITVRDGKTIYGYLTRPEGKGPFPLIMHPHGGPYGPRDRWGFNPEVQMLASRGYAVLQVNFRGSGGYGKDFMYSAFQQWAGEMQDDLTDSVRWAIDSGITEEGRVCIYGASYGGYSALMSAVKEPDLYACTAGYVGVYDLELMSKKGDIQRRDDGLDYINEAICDSPASCKAGSPITYLDRLKADVMIIHGKDDQRVPFAHAEVLRDELDKRDIDYEWLVKAKEGHGFVSVDNREELFKKLLAFFDKNIGS
ncbi:S9 family peptidase [Porticoccaceae bacterium]|nr:S9 family peptidase [Porticoccaceae bacterium]